MSTPSASSTAAGALLKRQLKQMQSDKDIPGISCGLVNDNNIMEWEVMLMINDDCKYYGGACVFFVSSLRVFDLGSESFKADSL